MNHHNQNNNQTMTLTGQGQVTAEPDEAKIRLGVQTTGTNLSQAQSDNARISSSILAALEKMGVSDIKTFQYLIEKNYEYENGARIDKGYSVRNIFEIKTSNIDQVGVYIDTSVNSGANIVEFISFEISNIDFYYQKALNLALLNAFEKADSISSKFGIPTEPLPLRIVENSSRPIPFSQFNISRERAYTTPIEPGEKQIDAFVTVEFSY